MKALIKVKDIGTMTAELYPEKADFIKDLYSTALSKDL